MALLARGFSQLRTSLLQVVRFNVDTLAASSTGTWRGLQARGFGSTYLDKDDVTSRIINIVKNFDNVDQSKVLVPTLPRMLWICVCLHDCTIFVVNRLPRRRTFKRTSALIAWTLWSW